MKQQELDIKYKDFEISTRAKTEMVKKHYRYVTIEGEEFNFDTIYDIMEQLDANYDIIITDKRLGEHFKKIGVLKTLGNKRWYMGAEKGDRFKQLMNQLDDAMEELYKE
jgi:hypothetical protein